MKTKVLFSVVFVAFACVLLSLKNPKKGVSEDMNSRTYTLKELKETYGKNLILDDKVSLESLEKVTVVSAANPCAGSGLQPCQGAEAHARAYAQQLANSCCCTVPFGWECCDPKTGNSYAVLFLTEPNNCH